VGVGGVVVDVATLEAALRGYRYTPGGRDPWVEGLENPAMADIFLRLAGAAGGLPPKQRQFAYVVAHEAGLRFDPDVTGRAGRTWASFVVQYHALVACEERFPVAIWHPKADRVYGLDILVADEAWTFVGLALRVPGEAGESYAAAKNGRHRSCGLVVRELICDPREHRVGPFWLYPPERLYKAVADAACEQRRRASAVQPDGDAFDAGYALALDTYARGEA